jgi:hypothetical protein
MNYDFMNHTAKNVMQNNRVIVANSTIIKGKMTIRRAIGPLCAVPGPAIIAGPPKSIPACLGVFPPILAAFPIRLPH